MKNHTLAKRTNGTKSFDDIQSIKIEISLVRSNNIFKYKD